MRREDRVAPSAGQGRRAHEDQRKNSASSLNSQQLAEWQRLTARIRALREPLRFSVDLRPTASALSDPRFGASVMLLLVECARSAFSEGRRECHGCCQPWTPKRAPVAVAIVEFLSFKGGGLVGICPECWDRPDRLQVAMAGFKRDFGLSSIDAATIHAGAWA